MKNLLLSILLLAGMGKVLLAKDGYHIQLKVAKNTDTMVYLAHYYGKPGPQIYVADSARIGRNGTVVFDSKSADFKGGIYMVLFKDELRSNFELLLNKGDDIIVSVDKNDLPGSVTVNNSPDNTDFKKYTSFTQQYADKEKKLTAALAAAKTADDTTKVRAEAMKLGKERVAYMKSYIAANPGKLLAKLFAAMQPIDIPEGTHYLEDGKTKDSTYAYRYYKAHYWDGFDLQDDRLVFTPLYDAKIDEYFNKLVLPWPDSLERECDTLLARTRGTRDMFHYTLFWLTRYVENSKVMGMDEVFVYLVERYYMKGDAFWLTPEQLAKFEDRAKAIAPNVIGNIAPQVKLPSVISGKTESLHDVVAPYTLLVFYSPTCGHCEHELPLLDSLYEASLKAKGVKVFTVATEGDEKNITAFLQKHNLDKKWINTWAPPQYPADFRSKYDVYSTPTIYLMNDKKIIKGKRLDHTNIGGLIEMVEKKRVVGR